MAPCIYNLDEFNPTVNKETSVRVCLLLLNDVIKEYFVLNEIKSRNKERLA